MFSGILSKQMFGVLGIHKVYNYTGRYLLKKPKHTTKRGWVQHSISPKHLVYLVSIIFI